MILRQYQENLILNISRKLASGIRKLVVQLATGGGKTICFAAISKRYLDKNPDKRVLILVHRRELAYQTRKTLYNAFGIEAQFIKAGMKFIPEGKVYVGMVESVNRRILKLKEIGLVIIDEAHIASFNKMHEHFPTQYILGFTATPLSSSVKRPVKHFYEDIVCGVDIPELIKEGHLCQNITWAPKETVNRLTLAVKGGEFDEGAMAAAFSKPRYIHNTVKAYEKWAKGTKTLIFNVNIDHSKEVTKAFIEAGYNAKHVDGTTPIHEREQIFHWFKTEPDAILNNVGITTVGFDEPTVESVVVNKATMSMPLWLQMDGRGSRPTEAKSAFTIIDMGGNAIVHGDWSQTRDWEYIFNNPQKPSKNNKEGVAPVKSCPKCEAIIKAGLKTCPYCGYNYPAHSIPVEVELKDFIVVTKGINVEEIVKANLHRKEHYAFFEMGRILAWQAKNTIPQMSDDFANFILLCYAEKIKEWMKLLPRRKIFNKWYQNTSKQYLFEEIKKHFPEWEPTQQVSAITQESVI